jgi:hypothetical protein
MSRVIAFVACGFALAGCTSGASLTSWVPSFDFPKAEPASVSVQFQSEPAGAEAKTSVGQSCKTPCALAVVPDKDFSVTFSLAGYQPQTVPVEVNRPEGLSGAEAAAETSLLPNPVAVELTPAPKGPAKRAPAPRKPAAAASAQAPAPRAAAPARPPAAAPAQPAPATDPWPPIR